MRPRAHGRTCDRAVRPRKGPRLVLVPYFAYRAVGQGVRAQLRWCLIRPGVCVSVWCDMSQGAGGANGRCFSRNHFNPPRHRRCGGEGSLYQCAHVERVLQYVLACVWVESSGFGMVCWRLKRPRLSAPRLQLKPLSASRPNVSFSSLIVTINNFEMGS